jgi:hypothetical protein
MVGFIFGVMGLVFAIIAMKQTSELLKEVEKLKSRLDPKTVV